jgi:acetolactate synthase I/II/III large subunit
MEAIAMNVQIPVDVSNAKRTLAGGAALAEMLRVQEIGPIFGMGGFQLLPFYEACRTLNLRHILINDERCGAFAADAYARVTNRPALPQEAWLSAA